MSSLPVESVGTDGFEHHIVTGVRRILPNGGVRESIQVSATTSRIATISWPGLPLAAIAVIAVAVFPLLYRFSLRTLLIATTLVAVGLGFMVWAAK
ncbi:MAG TPA: hypothetical protein VH107_16660 [Lacipirellulaceae bacterium]|nr:hypothetical protein [Lacipirellulaceae bacterium]